MIMQIFAIHDAKVDQFGTPFFSQNTDTALRSAGDLVLDPNTTVHRHPEDFSLWELGEFDSTTGQITDRIPGLITKCSALVPGKKPTRTK